METDATRDDLTARGLGVGDFVNRQWGRFVELRDPENNPLVIFQVAG